jgi:hypothetical protein
MRPDSSIFVERNVGQPWQGRVVAADGHASSSSCG